MGMAECKLCGKPFITAGPMICPACLKRLDNVYKKALDYLRDHPYERLNAKELAEAIDEDLVDVRALIELGWIERDISTESASEEMDKKRHLLKAFEKELSTLQGQSRKYGSYGYERHGRAKGKVEKDKD
ncbi:MAG TPA: hypothetical protein GXX52_06050 [Synergistaceae bacterium]|nr:hypothetical protein [Synergistaceae bacterium]